MSHEQTLKTISRAWGRNAAGFVFFPHIDRAKQVESGSRRAGYDEGPAFKWPQDKGKILAHMRAHEGHDLYWCPMVFEYPRRTTDSASDERALWADLDAADPRLIHDYPPSIAWETSPGRFQAVWIVGSGDVQGASWPGNENQRLTYHVGADPSGWDTTQLLRVPGWVNHKLEYGGPKGGPKGKLLWTNGRTYQPDDFEDLPPVETTMPQSALADAVEDEISSVDRHAVMVRVRLKLNRKAREILDARRVSGDRSESLWYLMRCLADVGCTVAEIVSVVRETPWNKFAERGDELKRLIIEASKAVSKRDPEATAVVEEEREARPAPTRLAQVIKDVKPPRWMVEGILTVGGMGFIAGEPKSHKSWFALDLAVSVAANALFLNHFRVLEPGPVLLIQEEDSAAMLKARAHKIWAGKQVDSVEFDEGEIVWTPGDGPGGEFDPDVNAYVQHAFVVSDPAWQEWLDETLASGMDGQPYKLVVIDTLMMVAGDVEETRAQDMTTKIFRPLKLLMRKHGCALMVVHHMRKSDPRIQQRGGQKMLGSVANHAWSEDSIYLSKKLNGDLVLDFESKSAPEARYAVSNLKNTRWEPAVQAKGEEERQTRSQAPKQQRPKRPPAASGPDVLSAVKALPEGQGTTKEVAERLGLDYQQTYRALNRALRLKTLEKRGSRWAIAG